MKFKFSGSKKSQKAKKQKKVEEEPKPKVKKDPDRPPLPDIMEANELKDEYVYGVYTYGRKQFKAAYYAATGKEIKRRGQHIFDFGAIAVYVNQKTHTTSRELDRHSFYFRAPVQDLFGFIKCLMLKHWDGDAYIPPPDKNPVTGHPVRFKQPSKKQLSFKKRPKITTKLRLQRKKKGKIAFKPKRR